MTPCLLGNDKAGFSLLSLRCGVVEFDKSILPIPVACKQIEEFAYIMLQIFCMEFACVS